MFGSEVLFSGKDTFDLDDLWVTNGTTCRPLPKRPKVESA
jgi:hypothetical protein